MYVKDVYFFATSVEMSIRVVYFASLEGKGGILLLRLRNGD